MEIDPQGVYIFATDTVYGLGTPLGNAEGVARIYRAKGRDARKPMAVLVADLAQADTLVDWPTPLYRDALRNCWPGALTAVLPARPAVPLNVRAGFATVGLRCPAHEALRQLLRRTGPWVATSVNPTGEAPMSDPVLIKRMFNDQVDGFLFFDQEPLGQVSTVLDLTVAPPQVLRQGAQDVSRLVAAFALDD